jgi:hypothetical protein
MMNKGENYKQNDTEQQANALNKKKPYEKANKKRTIGERWRTLNL